jgi:hypothetical protein
VNWLLAIFALSVAVQLPAARAQQQLAGTEGDSNRSALKVQPGTEAI